MSITQRDVVLQGKKDGQTTMDFPVTRLGNIEDNADIKDALADNDYIPVVDTADNEQMKKTLWSSIKTVLSNIFAAKSHTHNYAGSSSAGGAANSADKLNINAGSANNPVYFANGVPVKTTYTLEKSVPPNAVFTDTKYTHPTGAGNNHIPAGGASGQILRWSADGTAVWGADNNTTYGNMKGSTASAAGMAGLVPAPAQGTATRYLRSDGTWQVPPDTNTTYDVATASANGLMAAADKTKLNGIAAGATKNVIDTALSTSSTNAVQNKVVTAAINGKAAASHAHNYAGSSSAGGAATTALACTGNAATATKLATARNIQINLASTSAVSFNGTANVTPGVIGTLPVARGGTGNNTGYVTAGQKSGTTLGAYSTAEGYNTTASGKASHAEGNGSAASSTGAHAEGSKTTASANSSHAEGYNTTASVDCAHAEGYNTTASANCSHTEGYNTTASNTYAHAEGKNTLASGEASHSGGCGTVANTGYMTAIGLYNSFSGDKTGVAYKDTLLAVGKGDSDTSRANAFRVTTTKVCGLTYSSSGADYAEYFEWQDGNPNKEDRRGLFVTLKQNKIKIANAEDDFILGIVSGDPSVIGDAHDDQWNQMYIKDIFGSPVFEDAEIPEEKDGEGNIITPARTEHRQKLNPDYDNSKKYVPRSARPEWDAVGMMGKLVVVDDGSCVPDEYCKHSDNGKATLADTKTHYRAMERLDDTHIRILIL